MKTEALKLADELETRIATQGFEFTKEASTMLRRQAKRIEELEKETKLLQAKLNYMFEQELKSARVNR